MPTPAINRFVQFGNVSELAAQAASAATSLGHSALPKASLAIFTAIRRASFRVSIVFREQNNWADVRCDDHE
jgi:hypothetical protein